MIATDTDNLVLNKIQLLPDSLKEETLDFIDFLIYKTNKQSTKNTAGKKTSIFGCAKGKLVISDDFNEPLDDFKEYM